MIQQTATQAGNQYAAAHAAHYKMNNLHEALKLYRAIMDSHPSTEEAKYSRVQIQNIVNAVVSEQRLFDAQIDLAVALLEHGDHVD